MTTLRRAADVLPPILDDLARGSYPDYVDSVLTSTAHTRQRPAWTFPERWLPMVEIARERVVVPSLPWRSFSVVLLLALVLAAVTVLVGSQPRLPAPFGLARNGLVAYAVDGDIYTADPESGVRSAIVTGPETDGAPIFSRDGTRIVFARTLDSRKSQLYVARSDGSQLTLITPEPLVITEVESWRNYEFSPDGQSVLFMHSELGQPVMAVAQVDGSGIERLDVPLMAEGGTFRPPDGAEVLFVGGGADFTGSYGVFSYDRVGRQLRTIVKPTVDIGVTGATWSPDGSQIAYWAWDTTATAMTATTHIISANGTGDRVLPAPPDAVWNALATWSNEGDRIFLLRGYTSRFEDVRPAVLPADGTTVGVELDYPGTAESDCCSAWMWAPDDASILGRPTGAGGERMPQVTIDLVTGDSGPAPWASTSDPTWQRVAP